VFLEKRRAVIVSARRLSSKTAQKGNNMGISTKELVAAVIAAALLFAVVATIAVEHGQSPREKVAERINALANSAPVLDAHPGHLTPGVKEGGKAENKITAQDRQEAAQLVQALCSGNLAELQRVIDSYEGRDSAAARVTYVANVSLQLAGSKFRVIEAAGYFALQANEPVPGDVFVSLQPNKPAFSQVWRAVEGGGFASESVKVAPEEAFAGISLSIVNTFARK